MRKNTFPTLGILAILLLSAGLTSALAENGFEIAVTGAGSTTSNRISGDPGDVVTFSVDFINSNATYSTIDLTLSGTDITSLEQSVTGNTTLTVSFTIPNAQDTQSRILKGTVNASGVTIATISDSVYYTVDSASVSGCTDSNANNYNPTATVDDGSCVYNTNNTDTFCKLEGNTEKGDLDISDFDVNDKGTGDDDAWEYLDEIEVTVEVENTNRDDSVDDVEVRLAIFDNKIENGGKDVTNDFDVKDDVLTSINKLRDRDQESVTFKIEELPSDVTDGTYYMYIMAYEDGNEDNQCVSKASAIDDRAYFKFTVESIDYEDSVISKLSDSQKQIDTFCGQKNLEISFPVYNLGNDKEEKILVSLYNTALGIDESVVIDNLRDGKRETTSFFINIPSDLTKEKYDLKILTSFDWDDDKPEDEDTSYDEQTSESIRLKILECKAKTPSIAASLDSKTEVGQDLVVKTMIRNNADLANFVVTAMDFESWATLVSVTPSTSEIASGNTQEVTITLSPKEAGPHTFKINIISNGEVYNQPVSVNIAEKPGLFSKLEINRTVIYLVIAIAVLIIIIFLVLLARLTQREE